MTRTAYDPFKDESLIAPPPPKTRIRVDWRQGAKLLARGEPAESVAATLGISEERLWRHFHKSLRFQFLFQQARARNRLAAQLAFEVAARRAVVQRCGRIEEIDAESWTWLARETGLTPDPVGTDGDGRSVSSRPQTIGQKVSPDAPPPGQEFRLAAALHDAGRQPPNQALRNRIRKERKAMDAQFAELKAWGRAAGILPPAPEETAPENAATAAAGRQTEMHQAESQKSEISENKTQISADKNGMSAGKIAASTEKPPTAAAAAEQSVIPARHPAQVGGDDNEAAVNPVRIPRFNDVTPIDLTDMHGNPIPGREHLRR